jgi:HEAT repeat protein
MVCVSIPDPLLRSSLFVVEFRQAIRTAIPGIVECLVDSQWYVRSQAISALSKLGAHGLCERP